MRYMSPQYSPPKKMRRKQATNDTRENKPVVITLPHIRDCPMLVARCYLIEDTLEQQMSNINQCLLKQLATLVDATSLSHMASILEAQKKKQPKRQSVRLSASASHVSGNTPSAQTGQQQISTPGNDPECLKWDALNSIGAIRFCNSKAIYLQNNELPSLHSTDATENQCIRHTRTQRHINSVFESGDLLKVEQLQVFYSPVDTLRLFGTGWRVKSLTVIGCRLTDLSGINGFLDLETLFVSYNLICTLSDVAFNQTLKVIDLEGNHIISVEQVENLKSIDSLEMLNLDYNPVFVGNRQLLESMFGDVLQGEQPYLPEDEQHELQSLYGYHNVMLLHSVNKQLESKEPYNEVIGAIRKDKQLDYSEKQLNLDGRFPTEADGDYQLDDIAIFHNPKKALQKDSMSKYLNLKFQIQDDCPASNLILKTKVFTRKSSIRKSIDQRREQSVISSKNDDLRSTSGFNSTGFNPSMTMSASNTINDTTSSKPQLLKRKFILRKSSLKKETFGDATLGPKGVLSRTGTFSIN